MFRCFVCSAVLILSMACGPEASVADAPSGDVSAEAAQRVEAPPVQLRYAFAPAVCDTCSNWNGVIEVANTGFNKEVTVVWGREGVWFETQARYLRSINGARELWAFSGVGGSALTKLAIRYRVGGREYWDNNGGIDYVAATESTPNFGRVGTVAPMGPGVEVAATRIAASLPARGQPGNGLSLNVLVRNRRPAKEVSVVYTVDQWRTSQVAPLRFEYGTVSGSRDGGETWSGTAWFGTANRIEFALVAKQGGIETWDNNFGRNYECHLEAGSFVCNGP
jgi:hypothetical protein